MDVGLTIVVATMIFLPAFAALYQVVTRSRRKNRWAPGLAALAFGGTPRVFEALHGFAASRPPGGTRLVRGANEAIARIRERHPESSGGQLSVVDSSAAGARSETAEPGALSEVEPPARSPRKQET